MCVVRVRYHVVIYRVSRCAPSHVYIKANAHSAPYTCETVLHSHSKMNSAESREMYQMHLVKLEDKSVRSWDTLSCKPAASGTRFTN